MDALLDSFGLTTLLAATAIMAFGGFTKGAVGFALPMIAISGLGSFLPAHTALAALILPVFVTNLWQTLRQGLGAARETFVEFRLLILVLFVMIAASAQLVVLLPDRAMFLFLGVLITGFGVIQLLGWKPPSPESVRRPVEVLVGIFAGVSGGVSGVWGPPVLLYLIALDTPKVKQVRALGVVFVVGGVVLTVAHLRSGILDAQTTPLSLALTIPSVIGMAIGFAVQDRLEQKTFRRVTLIVLCVAGLNLLRRGVF